MPVRAAWGSGRVLDVNRNRSIEAHLANHGLDMFYGQGDPTDDPKGAEHARDTRLRAAACRSPRRDAARGMDPLPRPPDDLRARTSTSGTPTSPGTATHHLESAVAAPGFTAFYTNGALGDQMPRFDSYNRTAVMDLHGRRIAAKAMRAWRAAGKRLSRGRRRRRALDALVLLRPGGRAGPRGQRHAVLGARVLRRLGGRRVDLPRGALDRGQAAARGRCTSGARPQDHRHARDRARGACPRCTSSGSATGCCSARRASRASRWDAASRRRSGPSCRPGVTDPVVVGLANNYMGYLTTPEEYEMQHYEGGHTVYGMWTSLLAQDSVRRADAIARARRAGASARCAGGARRHRGGVVPRRRCRGQHHRGAAGLRQSLRQRHDRVVRERRWASTVRSTSRSCRSSGWCAASGG